MPKLGTRIFGGRGGILSFEIVEFHFSSDVSADFFYGDVHGIDLKFTIPAITFDLLPPLLLGLLTDLKPFEFETLAIRWTLCIGLSSLR